MKVLYDHQIFFMQKYGGISRYFFELIKEMPEAKHTTLFSKNHYLNNSSFHEVSGIMERYKFKGKERLSAYLNRLVSGYKVQKGNFDVFHPTYYDSYFLKYLQGKPFVLTVHDMIHEKFSHEFDISDSTSENKRLLVDKAEHIIAVSENTKTDLIELFNVSSSKISVIYLGSSLKKSAQNVIYKIPEEYILYVGLRNKYKNFKKFIISISKILEQNKQLCVVCVGGGNFTIEELLLFKELNIQGKLLQFNITDSSLSYFYSKARLFVFPSLYEGFGIPLLEAFTCNCPVACSNNSSLPEIALDAASYFNPDDIEDMQNSISTVLGNDKLRKKLIKNGTKRINDFSWEKTAQKTDSIYNLAAEQG